MAVLLLLVPRLLAKGLPPPAELPGPLVIVGGGGVPAEAREAFVTLAGKERGRIVVVPTASIDADNPAEVEGYLQPWRALKPASVQLLHTRDRKVADDPDFVKPLTEATGVWFSGGDQSRLTAAYKGTRMERELDKLHARGGVIGGTSAGAAVLSDPMITGGTTTASTGPGFGLLPGFIIDQHFLARNRQQRLAGVVTAHPEFVGLGIDEGTAVIVRGRSLRVIGKSAVTVLLAAEAGKPVQMRAAKAGTVLDLVELRKAAATRRQSAPAQPAPAERPVSWALRRSTCCSSSASGRQRRLSTGVSGWRRSA
jgi:cyanophycinase